MVNGWLAWNFEKIKIKKIIFLCMGLDRDGARTRAVEVMDVMDVIQLDREDTSLSLKTTYSSIAAPSRGLRRL